MPEPEWMLRLDPNDPKTNVRMQSEVRLGQTYKREFNHGTSGHLGYMVIARLVELMADYAWGQRRANQRIEFLEDMLRRANGDLEEAGLPPVPTEPEDVEFDDEDLPGWVGADG